MRPARLYRVDKRRSYRIGTDRFYVVRTGRIYREGTHGFTRTE